MAKKQNVVTLGRERRDAMLKRKTTEPVILSTKQRETILQLLEEGATLSEIFTIRGIAGFGSFYRARAADPVYDDSVRKALAQGAEAAIAEAAEISRKAAESSNPDEMRVAESFHRCALAYAEKAAPREYGQLIKLGGADGGALSLQVVSYAVPAIVGKAPQMLEAPRADIADAEFEAIGP